MSMKHIFIFIIAGIVTHISANYIYNKYISERKEA